LATHFAIIKRQIIGEGQHSASRIALQIYRHVKRIEDAE